MAERSRGRAVAAGALLSALVFILPGIVAVPLAYAVKLDREQRKTARQADREADRFGASPKERLALFEALAVEATFHNPAGGDQDSVGSLQERDHYGSVARRLNVKLASRRFLSEARAMRERGFHGSAGDLAAAVQRPREDLRGRYHEERGTALEVVNRYGGLRGNASSGGSGGVAGGAPSSQGGSSGVSAFSPGDPATANMSLAAAAPVPIASAGVAEPEFAARPALPEGYRAAPSIGGPSPAPAPEALLASTGLSEDFSPDAAPKGGSGGSRGSGGASGPRGEGLMGARQLVSGLGEAHGLPVTARKEPGHAAGGDHDPAVRGATAWDFGGSEGQRRAAFRDLMRSLGVKGAKYKGADVNVTVGGVRYQVISRDHGTGPHLHVGARKA